MKQRPNIILILNDDMGYSDIGCYGGEIRTPALDSLAAGGLRYTQFYNTARCCPSRASLLTGLHPHQADVGHMMGDDGIDGYLGDLNPNTVTIAEALKADGYATCMSGKWHVTRHVDGPKHNWPAQRGFDDYYGIITGAANYYHPLTLTRNNARIEAEGDDYFLTDAISDEAVRQIREHAAGRNDMPFFQYVAYTAPHWPLHAHEADIAAYRGRFDAGWDALREARRRRMIDLGILDRNWALTERDPDVGPWEDEPHKAWQTRRMEVYAAQVERMDRGIGRLLDALRETGQWENTLIVFLADNGGCAEELSDRTRHWVTGRDAQVGTALTRDGREVRYGNDPDIIPGAEDTYASYGLPWANVSNAPFRLYKHWVHEGGIATPFIAHWPAGIREQGALRHQPAQLPDVMATFLDVAGAPYPATRDGREVKPLEGFSLAPTFSDRPHGREVLYWEHEGNRAVRKGRWKLVNRHPGGWELYDIEADRTELHDVAGRHPEIVSELSARYEAWAARCNVMPWDEVCRMRRNKQGEQTAMTNHTDTDPYPGVGYDQAMRPQFHFTSKQNWINDPNGLVYHEGEYHLFFQHNPSGWAWGNMTWGHAVSPDLLHWKQLPHALLPDALGTIYSGSAVVDHADTSGFADGDRKALVAVFTYAGDHADPKQPFTQAIAYSTDRGRTFTKYPGNPVLENISGKSDRDPKVFWYQPPGSESGGWWVMVLFLDARRSLGIFTSPDLKTWKQESEIEGFHECPELFELPVDGNPDDRRWVLYGANYEYYIGSFDGRTFTPGHESKYKYQFGVGYASQTWNDEPRGRRVQIGWGRVEMKDMPFNQMMLFPVELSLRTTEEGVRLFAEPVDELETLRDETQAEASDVTVTPGQPLVVKTAGDLFEVRLDVAPGDTGKVHLCFNEMVLTYDAEAQTLDGAPLQPEAGRVSIQALIDRPCVEVFGNGGRVMTGRALPGVGEVNEMTVRAEGGAARVVSMTVTGLKSVFGTSERI